MRRRQLKVGAFVDNEVRLAGGYTNQCFWTTAVLEINHKFIVYRK